MLPSDEAMYSESPSTARAETYADADEWPLIVAMNWWSEGLVFRSWTSREGRERRLGCDASDMAPESMLPSAASCWIWLPSCSPEEDFMERETLLDQKIKSSPGKRSKHKLEFHAI
ncbi:Os02g0740800 [Oryza sativa Japonica Group]|uniref:Os02g0740800 protein n=1 Tax=Oryza sativa subsp. japonica TaxID=39947 RepID=Q0DXP8_ORYSJ|nr:Os02g0740800 [Oryza sativa Japonica Group]|eukprot:NP_001048076.1 Os02g0740800 [Oryza sativa Japonica Group]